MSRKLTDSNNTFCPSYFLWNFKSAAFHWEQNWLDHQPPTGYVTNVCSKTLAIRGREISTRIITIFFISDHFSLCSLCPQIDPINIQGPLSSGHGFSEICSFHLLTYVLTNMFFAVTVCSLGCSSGKWTWFVYVTHKWWLMQ